jgi:YidC/Oxa1 family membrane protein insertase
MKIMPLMFFVFAVNVPLAVIIYWVTTNFWSVGQQYMLLRSAPVPASAGADVEAAPAGAAAVVENGGGRKGILGPLSMFRGLSQPRATEEKSPAGNKNGNRNAKAGGNVKAGGSGNTKAGGSGNTKATGGKAAPKQGGSPAKGAAQARPGQPGRQGTSGNRRSGSRSSGKGKSSGPRRGKR